MTNAFLHPIDDMKDYIYYYSKKFNQKQFLSLQTTKGIMSSGHFLMVVSVKPSPDMDIILAQLSKFAMFESARNVFSSEDMFMPLKPRFHKSAAVHSVILWQIVNISCFVTVVMMTDTVLDVSVNPMNFYSHHVTLGLITFATSVSLSTPSGE